MQEIPYTYGCFQLYFANWVAAVERRITEVDRRLYSGEVSASRELQAMAAEIEALKRRRSDGLLRYL